MKTKFYLGQKVLCVNPTGYLAKDKEYTVPSLHNDGTDITVEECYNKTGFQAYKGSRFSPLEVQVSLTLAEIEDLKIAHSLITFLKDSLTDVDSLDSILMKIQQQR